MKALERYEALSAAVDELILIQDKMSQSPVQSERAESVRLFHVAAAARKALDAEYGEVRAAGWGDGEYQAAAREHIEALEARD